MGRIILTDVPDPFATTFADDHYHPDLKNEHIKVVAQLPNWADVRWYHDLVRRLRHEVKGGWVAEHWEAIGSDIRDAINRCIREALITISDSSMERLEIRAEIENQIGRPIDKLDHPMRKKVELFVDERLELGALFDSPGYRALRYVEGDTFDITKLRRKLGNAHNVHLFAARVAAALAEYLDPDHRRRAIEAMIDRRYFLNDELTALFMADAVAPNRTFDQGNTKVVNLIQEIRTDVAERIRGSEQLWLLLPAGSGTTTEADSRKSPHVAAADIASRIAGDLYQTVDGLRKVLERFRMVILNGSVIRV